MKWQPSDTAELARKTRRQKTRDSKLTALGYKVDYWYADEGMSGKVSASQWPQFAKLLGQIRDGETLVVSKLDRLGRDAMDVCATIKALAAQRQLPLPST